MIAEMLLKVVGNQSHLRNGDVVVPKREIPLDEQK